VWAIVSTLLLGGFIWYVSGSWIVALAALWGLLVHEYGHVLAMNRLGMGPAHIYVIPFLGGLAQGQRLPASEWHGVLVSLAGPAFGMLAVIPFFALHFVLGDPAWLLGAAVIAAINLVNLAPAPPLDGSKALGPVLARVHPLLEKAAMLAVGAVVVVWGLTGGSYIFAGFLVLALFAHLRRGGWRPEGRPLTWPEAARSVALFTATVAVCAAGGLAALMLATGGGPAEALEIGARYFRIDR
jgi:Zn-dependent protease